MKKLLLLLAVALPCLIFTACSKEDDDIPGTGGAGQGVGSNTGETSVTGGVETLYITGAEVVCYLNVSDAVLVNTTFGVVYGTKSGVTIDNKEGYNSTTSLEGKEYKVTISELEADTKYYYRSYARIGSNYVYGAEKSFTTKGVKVTAELAEQEGSSATFTCTTMLGEFDLQGRSNSYGLVWGTSANLAIDNAEGRQSANGLTDGTYTISANKLKYTTKYYYRAYTCTGSKYTYSEAKSFTTGDKPAAKIGNAVDLGLSVKWADMNVGASSPEDYGDYFAWGETEPKSPEYYGDYYFWGDTKPREVYDWKTYKWCVGLDNRLTKYCTDSSYGYNGFKDNKTTLDPEDDAATANWGSGWRMPTRDELDELRTKCHWTWTIQVGVKGYKVTGPNGNSLFLPAAGTRSVLDLDGAGSWGWYWSSLSTGYSGAYFLCFDSYDVVTESYSRCYGRSVRPVCQ